MSRNDNTGGRPLLELLAEAHIAYTCSAPLENTFVTHMADDSRRVRPGALFAAIKGASRDGHAYIAQAVDAGASAILLTDPDRADLRVPCLQVQDIRSALGQLASVLEGLTLIQAAGEMTLIGITGTNGKSTTCHLINQILRRAGRPAALLGTIHYDLLGRTMRAPWTTPPAPQLVGYITEAHRHGARYTVMEVSSHALDQQRVAGLKFDVALFTNLSGDHLDYHGNLEDYGRSKKRLFDDLPPQSTAVINADDPWAAKMISDCRATVRSYGLRQPADVTAHDIVCDIEGARFTLCIDEREERLSIPLVGRHNVSNSLAAAAVALYLDIDLTTISAALGAATTAAGRLQHAEPAGHPFAVFVDYAHTDDALENVLSALRPLTSGSLWCVFGCGGDRDRTKRPRMAAVSAKYADRIVVTSDNPRNEPPNNIIDEIVAGFGPRPRSVEIEPDRRRAIEFALRQARPKDVVLIAGKGHEDYQIIGDNRTHFDDREIVQQFLSGACS